MEGLGVSKNEKIIETDDKPVDLCSDKSMCFSKEWTWQSSNIGDFPAGTNDYGVSWDIPAVLCIHMTGPWQS